METQPGQLWLTSVMATIFLLTFIDQHHMTTANEGSFFKILTTGNAYTMSIHESLVLECEFSTEYFYLFDNPVLWMKTQQNEATYINLMGNINKPFAATGRFEVSFTPEPPRYHLELAIVDLSLQDSGNYTCEVRGRQSTILGQVTHQIFVRAPVENIYITRNNSWMTTPTDVDTSQITGTTRGLTFIEGYPQTLCCTSEGGFPAPEMLIYIGNHDVTSNFTLTHRETWTGLKGLRVVSYTTERIATQLMARPQFDGKTMQCIVTVPGIGANITTVKIKVRYTPVICCYSTKAYLRDSSVTLRCEVKAKPGLTRLYWLIDDKGTKLSGGGVENEYWTINEEKRNGVLETQLFIRRVKASSFRKYTVVAENGIGIARNDVELVRGYRVPRKMYGEAGKIPRDRRPSRGYSKLSSGGATGQLDALTCLITSLCLLTYVNGR